MFVVKMILPSTGHSMNFWHHHEQLRKFILEHTSIPRKRKTLKIFYFPYFTKVKLTAKTYTAETNEQTKELYISGKLIVVLPSTLK